MSILLYMLKVSLCSGILYGYYHLFLRNKRFHHYNRFYLLGTLVLSMVLPLIEIPVFNEDTGRLNHVVYQTVRAVTLPSVEQAATPLPTQQASPWFTLSNLTWILYGAGMLFLLVVLGRSLGYIRKISRRYPFERVDDLRKAGQALKFYQTREPGTPFSFFRSIFWNEALNFNSQQGQQIFRHELFHVQQKHSVDILLAEIITMLGWFNPFFYLIKKELKAIHEFLADQYAASGSNRYQYAELLVEQVMTTRAASLTHPFFQHQLKRRITMITQLNQTKYGYWSRVMVLPLSVILFFSLTLYAGENKNANNTQREVRAGTSPVPVNIANSSTDTVPKIELELQKLQELEIAEKKAAEEKQVQFRYNEQRFKGNELEVVREKQLVLQKVLQENKMKHEELSVVLQQELHTLKQQEKHLQELREVSINNNKNQHFNYEENRDLDNARNQLLALKKDLSVSNDVQKVLRLQEIDSQLSALEDVRKKEVAAQKHFNYNEDTTLGKLQRFFNQHFRYPEEMLNNNGEGSTWYSFLLDESGKLRDYEVYDKEPIAQGRVHEIVIVGYSKQPGNTLSAEKVQKQMKQVVLQIAGKGGRILAPGRLIPTRYYFKATFKLEK